MAQENITVKLPGCGGVAEIRSFVKNKDRKAISRLSLTGTEVSPEDVKDETIKIKIKAENMVEVASEQARRLLISYDGNTEDPYEAMMDSEYQQDMETVEAAVQKVFDKGGDAEARAKKLRTGASDTTAS